MSTLPIPRHRERDRLAHLNPATRAVLVTDGTVTPLLEQLVGERIVTARLTQSTKAAGAQTAEGLHIEEGTPVLARTTDLIGADTGKLFIQAEAMIRLEALPTTLRADLLTTEHPIGRLLLSHRFESFRELLTWSVPPDPLTPPIPHADSATPAGPTGSHAADSTAAGTSTEPIVAERCYRVIHARRPAFLITERFTASCFPDQ